MSDLLRIGMIGLDTSHVAAFTGILNDPQNPNHVAGGRVTVAFPGGSPDIPLSKNRVEGFTNELRGKHGVKIADSPQAVAEACDLLFIESMDGRVHRQQFESTVEFKRPTFIDKPLALGSADAKAIFHLARQHNVPVMSCSSLRYPDHLQEYLKVKRGAIVGVDAFGRMPEEPTQPGLFWYGIHTVEAVVAAMGPGCKEVRAVKNADFDLISCEWSDGRVASIRGHRKGHGNFGIVLHDDTTATYLDLYDSSKRPPYACMLEVILRTLPKGQSDIPEEETLGVIRLIEAANESRKTGEAVRL